MAIVASRALEGGDKELTSVDTLVARIVWGEDKIDQTSLESLQVVSLFTIIGMENNASHELNEIATFCNRSPRRIYNELHRFVERGVFCRQGDYGRVQPIPLA
ncbi:MAG: hypothetical protein ACK53L_10345, partial [Pirellulaceae bacterium]